MVASRRPWRLPLAASISRSISASVRCSRVRRSALGRRPGGTVRFTVAGATSLRRGLAKVFARLESALFVKWFFYDQCKRTSLKCRGQPYRGGFHDFSIGFKRGPP
jgi:hypothetical protein